MLVTLGLAACQGEISEKPPIHLNPNMDDQNRYDPMSESTFFSDKRTLRPIPAGTVARGLLKEDDHFYRGKLPPAAGGAWATTFPFEVTSETIKRGERKFNTYCTPCHGPLGNGKGIVTQRGYPPATDLHDARIRDMAVGEIFNSVSHGIRNMPGYAAQLVEQDRWAVLAYLRALQRSQFAKLEDVPEDKRGELK